MANLINKLKGHSQVWDNFWQLKTLLKWWKILLNTTIKALFVSWIFDYVEKKCDQKNKVNFKICDVTTWETNNTIHILPNIGIGKDNHAMKSGQLIEHNMRSSFLEVSCTKSGGETTSRLFFKKLKLSISLDQ